MALSFDHYLQLPIAAFSRLLVHRPCFLLLLSDLYAAVALDVCSGSAAVLVWSEHWGCLQIWDDSQCVLKKIARNNYYEVKKHMKKKQWLTITGAAMTIMTKQLNQKCLCLLNKRQTYKCWAVEGVVFLHQWDKFLIHICIIHTTSVRQKLI